MLLWQRFRQLLECVALLLREPFRRLHLHGREQIASTATVDVGHALAAQSERRPGLRALRYFDLVHAVERRHLDLAAERHRRVVHGNLAEEVVSVAPEELVLLDVNDDVEAAGWSAGGSGFAFAGHSQLLASRDASGNLDRELTVAGD